MGTYKEPQKVKLFVGVITKFTDELYLVQEPLKKHFGEIDLQMSPIPFNFTDYYLKEQGSPLFRIFYSFTKLILQQDLPKIKRWTNFVEEALKNYKNWGVKRPFNLDPGYLSLSNLVLASTKPYCHRLYLGNYIYAEVTLIYKNNTFISMPWTYKDYQSKEYNVFFSKMRDILKRNREKQLFRR